VILFGVAPACVPPALVLDTGQGSGGGSTKSDAAFGMGGTTGESGNVQFGGMPSIGDATSDGRRGSDAASDSSAGIEDGSAVGRCPQGLPGPSLVEVTASGHEYCIDKDEVSDQDYEFFLDANVTATGQAPPCAANVSFVPTTGMPLADDLPIRNVTWCDAAAYCAWAGKRLCGKVGGGPNAYGDFARADSSEWYAACSNDGRNSFPYGNTYDGRYCVGPDSDPRGAVENVTQSPECKTASGIYNLSGNVWEWENSCGTTAEYGFVCRARGGAADCISTGAPGSAIACDADSSDQAFPPTIGQDDVGIRCCADSRPPR
jgi:formylglycine-generating enzyme required for sulfatase activity